MTNLFEGLRGGISLVSIGPGGTGKSTLLASAAEHGNAKLAALRPKEVDSFGYREHGLNETAELFHDARWAPSLDSYEADGYQRFIRWLWEMQEDDETDVVLIDPGTDIHKLISHQILKTENAETAKEMNDPFAYWGTLRDKWLEVLDLITSLNYAERPKHVLMSMHAKVPHEEDQEKEGLTYFGRVRPHVQGSIKDDLEAYFQIVLYNKIIHTYDQKERKQVPEYKVEVRANSERHNKVSLAPSLNEAVLPNDFGAVLRKVQEAMNDA